MSTEKTFRNSSNRPVIRLSQTSAEREYLRQKREACACIAGVVAGLVVALLYVWLVPMLSGWVHSFIHS